MNKQVEEADGYQAKREAVWRQLISHPQRDTNTIVLVCAEQGVDTNRHYVHCTRARWRDTLRVLKEAGIAVPE